MTKDGEFKIRPGAIRAKSVQRQRPFIYRAMAAAQKAGGHLDRRGQLKRTRGLLRGRGRSATLVANLYLPHRARLVVIKARIVRHRNLKSPLKLHLRYLQREGVTKGSERAQLFGRDQDSVNASKFADRCHEDRHHFRFIVAPQDGLALRDLDDFTRDLMQQAEYDLGTKLDWVGVSHWNTETPHVHILLRGVTDQGEDLVISRDYIKSGLRARAMAIITDELGPRTDQEIHQHLNRQIEAERFTDLDRKLLGEARRYGFVDLAHERAATPDPFHVEKVGRMRKLEALGLADQFAPSQWIINDTAEQTLRQLGERGDIIKRLHRSLGHEGLDRATSSWDLAGEALGHPIVGRLMARGLDDELMGSAYAIIDGIDGHTHHVRLPHLEAATHSQLDAIVEFRPVRPEEGAGQAYLVSRSDLTLQDQIHAEGATWIDRLAIMGADRDLAKTGFGETVRQAIRARGHYLTEAGLAMEAGDGYRYSRDLLKTLKARDLDMAKFKISKATGLSCVDVPAGAPVEGVLKRRLDLASGRFAVLEDGMGFRLVPWSRGLENKLGQTLSGVSRDNGRIDWSHGLKRGLDIG